MRDWSLRYTAHLGYAPPAFRPQFAASCGETHIRKQINYAATIGMAGILYPWAPIRFAGEVEAVRHGLAATGLLCSCMVALRPPLLMSPVWTDTSAGSRARLRDELKSSATLAKSLGARILAVLVGADPVRDPAAQRADVASNLRFAASIAADHGLTLGVEPMILAPGMLLHSTRETLDVIAMADHEAVRMIFDTGHVHQMDGDVLAAFRLAFERICLLQIADMPGRVEPGAGTLNLLEIAAEAIRRGYEGLVDLEHGWREESLLGEQAGLERLRNFDDQLKQLRPFQPITTL